MIGGSFALAARRAGLSERITGWGGRASKAKVKRQKAKGGSGSSLDKAIDRGVIDGIEEAFDAGRVSDADLVYLAAPVGAIMDFLQERGKSIKPGAIITDAGSTKREICRAARERLPEGVSFVGGHPMAGSHNTGVEFADADIFRGAPYALMIDEQGEQDEALSIFVECVKAIGSRPVLITPERHDRVIARLSHLPQLLSTALAISAEKSSLPEGPQIAGPGFAEMTRLGESRWSVWEDICRTNADEIASALGEMSDEIEEMRRALVSENYSDLGRIFQKANEFLEAFNRKMLEED